MCCRAHVFRWKEYAAWFQKMWLLVLTLSVAGSVTLASRFASLGPGEGPEDLM